MTSVEVPSDVKSVMGSMTTTSQDLTSFVTVNKNNIIGLADSSRPTLELLAKYAPEYPCLLKGLAEFEPIISKAFGEGTNEPVPDLRQHQEWRAGDEVSIQAYAMMVLLRLA